MSFLGMAPKLSSVSQQNVAQQKSTSSEQRSHLSDYEESLDSIGEVKVYRDLPPMGVSEQQTQSISNKSKTRESDAVTSLPGPKPFKISSIRKPAPGSAVPQNPTHPPKTASPTYSPKE